MITNVSDCVYCLLHFVDCFVCVCMYTLKPHLIDFLLHERYRPEFFIDRKKEKHNVIAFNVTKMGVASPE